MPRGNPVAWETAITRAWLVDSTTLASVQGRSLESWVASVGRPSFSAHDHVFVYFSQRTLILTSCQNTKIEGEVVGHRSQSHTVELELGSLPLVLKSVPMPGTCAESSQVCPGIVVPGSPCKQGLRTLHWYWRQCWFYLFDLEAFQLLNCSKCLAVDCFCKMPTNCGLQVVVKYPFLRVAGLSCWACGSMGYWASIYYAEPQGAMTVKVIWGKNSWGWLETDREQLEHWGQSVVKYIAPWRLV